MSLEQSKEPEKIRESRLKPGDILRHVASHNRYQEYRINDVYYDKDLMMGAGGYVYVIDFFEWDSSSKRKQTQVMRNWKTVEINLPLDNTIGW